MNHRFVFDTNSLISAVLLQKSVNSRALLLALEIGRIVISEPVLLEFSSVIFRKKFDKYFLNDVERLEAIKQIASNSINIFPNQTIDIYRDPKDNIILELAISAKASCVITGDQDLLILNPFRNIPIMTASEFLRVFDQSI